MSARESAVVSRHEPTGGNLQTYVSGFILSIFLTLAAYVLVTNHAYSDWTIALVIAGLAGVQFVVQLLFFLHLGRESRPRWRLLVLSFMLLVVGILVIGSLWIMHSLNYRMTMTPQQVNNYLQDQDGGI
ncbi:MAG TPA: cytochrome o ubiquinol oxidase subunit IV [Candidatus Saccharimonadales bacterium]|jgi:cytochrome o ubiquinol oxidase operon protein cyoD